MKKSALILLGHGSKSIEAIGDFNFIVDTVKQKANFWQVAGAHMELAHPSLEEVTGNLYDIGGREFIILPYFLYNGVHIKQDIPSIIEKLKVDYPEATFRFGRPIGKEVMMADLLIKQANEVLL